MVRIQPFSNILLFYKTTYKSLRDVYNFWIFNTNRLFNSYLLVKDQQQLKLLFKFIYVRDSFYFVILLVFTLWSRLVFSKSLNSLIAMYTQPNLVFFKKNVFFKPHIWKPFFHNFFFFLPINNIFIIFCNWIHPLTPLLELFYSFKYIKGIFFLPKITYGIIKLKKTRRIKKKIKKKLFIFK